jgi:AcrR family transcriptional regulator
MSPPQKTGMAEKTIERVVPVDRAGREGGHVIEMQRRRLLSATVELAYEQGVQALTVATVCGRAGLSRRTFYDVFGEREDCLYAAYQDAVEQATRVVHEATTGSQGWLERTRTGLRALLSFFDREPAIARLLVVEGLSSGERTLQARAHILEQAAMIIDQGREHTKTRSEPPPLTAEATVGAVFSVIHARILQRARPTANDTQPLAHLCSPLMATIAQPYLGAVAAQKELERPTPALEESPTPRLPSDPFKDLPLRFTYRTARVLTSIAQTPGASSKQVATAAGITDPGQISRLLARLRHNGLIQDTSTRATNKGLPRAWTLTQRGENILQATGHG